MRLFKVANVMIQRDLFVVEQRHDQNVSVFTLRSVTQTWPIKSSFFVPDFGVVDNALMTDTPQTKLN